MAQRHYQRGRKPTLEECGRLMEAIEKDDTTTIRQMIQQQSIDVNANIHWEVEVLKVERYTALHYAVKHDKLQCVKLLVQLGADVTKTDHDLDDNTRLYNSKIPLQRAVDKNRLSIVHYFIKEYNQDITTLDQKYQRKIHNVVKVYRSLVQKQEKIEKIAYDLALRSGTAKALGIKLLLVGAENVGKSCIAATLVGDPFQECAATEGADLEICNTSNWVKITQEEASQRLNNEYLSSLKSSAVKNASAAENIESRSNPTFFTKIVRLFTSKGSNDDIHAKETPTVKAEDIKKAKAADDTATHTQDGIDVTILDFAGQTQYHNTHSAFIRKENIIMVVFNASQPLSQNVKLRSGTLKSDTMTNSQSIHYWMKTIHSICHEPGDESDKSSLLPIILLVATHLDLLGDCAEESKQQIIQILADELEGKPYAEHLAGHGEGLLNALKKYCIFLSNKHRDPKTVQLLRNAVIEVSSAFLSKELPLVFLKIEKVLLGINKGVISKDEFHHIAYTCGYLAAIESEEFAVALQYFHDRGVILHFAYTDSLKELVILSPHWLTKLFSYVLIAHPYQRIGGRHDNAYRILTHKGILVGSFLFNMLSLFNSSEKYANFEIEQKQAVDLMKKFYFVAQIDHKAKFLKGVKFGNEKELYIVPSLLPSVTDSQLQIPESHCSNVKVVYFYLPDCFIPTMLFSQMMAMCINRNKEKHDDILWLTKDEGTMVLGRDQYFSINLCEQKYSIQLSFILLPGGQHSADRRIELLQYFQCKVEMVMEDFMKASTKPVAYIPCCFCDELHVEFQRLLEGEQQHCASVGKPLPDEHYRDLITDEGAGAFDHKGSSQHASANVDPAAADITDSSAINQVTDANNCDTETVSNVKGIFNKFYPHLVKSLPMKDAIFMSRLVKLLPGDLKEKVESKPTTAEAASCFLDNEIKRALEIGDSKPFMLLISAMENFDSIHLRKLSEQMRSDMDILMAQNEITKKD